MLNMVNKCCFFLVFLLYSILLSVCICLGDDTRYAFWGVAPPAMPVASQGNRNLDLMIFSQCDNWLSAFLNLLYGCFQK